MIDKVTLVLKYDSESDDFSLTIVDYQDEKVVLGTTGDEMKLASLLQSASADLFDQALELRTFYCPDDEGEEDTETEDA